MTNLEFQGICGLHEVNPEYALEDEFVLKVLKSDKENNRVFNHITLSTYFATDKKYQL